VTIPADLINQTGDLVPIEIAAGAYQSVALCGDGSVRIWGLNSSPAVSDDSIKLSARQVSSGLQHVAVLVANSSVKAFGADQQNQVTGPKALQQVLALACGDNRTLVVVDTALPLPNDIDGDGCTNGVDLGLLLVGWGTDGAVTTTDDQGMAVTYNVDLNGDGVVNGVDLGLLLNDWYANPFCGN
jgi:hypothetical protein